MYDQYREEDVYVCSLLLFVYSHLTVGLLTAANSDYEDKKKRF